MSVKYAAVKWNRNKRVYDYVLAAGVALYLGLFIVVGKVVWGGSDEVLLIRALGTCAFLLLHVVLCIGPLARFDRRLLPVLYNRRHLGVATFLVGLAHGVVTTGYYHGFGRTNPLVSLLATNTAYGSPAAFPFEILGVIALLILFLMAATSHDFWQKNLSGDVWKWLHFLVYPAYGLLVLHVSLGALHSERGPLYVTLVAVGLAVVAGLHLAAAARERRRERHTLPMLDPASNWVDAGAVDEIPDCRAKVICAGGERIAVFRYGEFVSAVTNVCASARAAGRGEGRGRLHQLPLARLGISAGGRSVPAPVSGTDRHLPRAGRGPACAGRSAAAAARNARRTHPHYGVNPCPSRRPNRPVKTSTSSAGCPCPSRTAASSPPPPRRCWPSRPAPQ